MGKWAHPRAGGENAELILDVLGDDGSSPRGRGKLNPREIQRVRERLIPARAGKTLYVDVVPSMKGAHPRAGGENLLNCTARLLGGGSSPRGRGKP